MLARVAWFTGDCNGHRVWRDSTSPEDVVFTARSDNSVQKYLVIYPKAFRADEPHHLLILLHGHGSDRWQAVDDSVNEFRAGRDSANARKMLVVSPDYRARTSWMGPKADADLLQIIDELKGRFRIGKTILAGVHGRFFGTDIRGTAPGTDRWRRFDERYC